MLVVSNFKCFRLFTILIDLKITFSQFDKSFFIVKKVYTNDSVTIPACDHFNPGDFFFRVKVVSQIAVILWCLACLANLTIVKRYFKWLIIMPRHLCDSQVLKFLRIFIEKLQHVRDGHSLQYNCILCNEFLTLANWFQQRVL